MASIVYENVKNAKKKCQKNMLSVNMNIYEYPVEGKKYYPTGDRTHTHIWQADIGSTTLTK